MRPLILAILLCAPSLALAQDPAPTVLPPVVVHGTPPAPITVFIPRARMHYERTDLSRHAVDRIVESVRHAPF